MINVPPGISTISNVTPFPKSSVKYLPSPVSQELGKVLDKLLKVEIRERYQSADKVIKDLEISPTFVVSPGGNKNQSLGNSPTTINRRGYIYGGLFLGGVTVAFMGQNLFSGKQNQTSISDNLKAID
ncbi:hypothetical protein MEN41_11860 [Dolichospermum sp. ST_con]|nr:hypothetical protein [Dolichospermum sp. ST_con]